MLGCLAVPTHFKSDFIASLRLLHEEETTIIYLPLWGVSPGVNWSSACDGELADLGSPGQPSTSACHEHQRGCSPATPASGPISYWWEGVA